MAIFHLVWDSDWKQCCFGGLYQADSLATEGFIHCTREPAKLIEVANLFFDANSPETLWRLTLDETRLASEVRDEDPGVGHLFPHVYGPIEVEAVIDQKPMRRGPDGWQLPEE